jgi:TPR repeat protein
MYRDGQGVLQDYVMAHMYWNVAAVSGDKDAIYNRGIVEKDMTSSQIAEAQKLAREWMRTHQ